MTKRELLGRLRPLLPLLPKKMQPRLRMQIIRALAPPGLLLGNDVYIEQPDCFSIFGSEASIAIGDESIFWGKSIIHAYGRGSIAVGRRCIGFANAQIYCRDCVEFGHHVLAGWDLTIIDYEAHPIDNKLREKQGDYMISNWNPFCRDKNCLEKQDIDFFNTYWDNDATFDHAPVRIGNNCWIGYGVSIMKGVTIGDNTIIASKSVVMTSLPSNCVAAGNPARGVKRF
jgi:acetyltransferase-like isoleucine patch superfamily enzyme